MRYSQSYFLPCKKLYVQNQIWKIVDIMKMDLYIIVMLYTCSFPQLLTPDIETDN